MNSIVQDLLAGEKRQTGAADMVLDAAGWAASSYADFDRARVDAIARAAAEAGYAASGALGKAAVKETGLGVAAHKEAKNELASRSLYARYRDEDYCSRRLIGRNSVIELPRPMGVIFGLTPSTSPVSTVYAQILLAVMTRNAIVIASEAGARDCSAEAMRVMAEAAEKAGAPASLIQVIDGSSPTLIDYIRRSPKIDRTIGADSAPGNVPVLVDATADITLAAKRIVESKAFDNALLRDSESVVVAEADIAGNLLLALRKAGAYIAKPNEVDKLRALLFGLGAFNGDLLGKSASEIGKKARLQIPAGTKIIVAEIDRVGIDEPLSMAKPCPVLGFIRAEHADAGIGIARALVRLPGIAHAAAIYSQTAQTILKYATAVKAGRVAVNAPCGPGADGSAMRFDLEPKDLVVWTGIAYNDIAAKAFGGVELSPSASTILGREAPMSLGVLQEGAARRKPAPRGAKPRGSR
jgi:acetaldehyde dehydrogenase / alcohol dehydrogenase